MTNAPLLWSVWQALLSPFHWAFTRPGYRRFVEWVTALAINVEEPTVTPSVVALERTADGKALERFAESGAWDSAAVTRHPARLIEEAPGRVWHGYPVSAVDDTKVHRSGKGVWGTCPCHESTARGPNRAATVRAPNGVVGGARLHHPDPPAWFLPVSGRLYFRQSQLPARSGAAGPTEAFRTQGELAVERIREQARTVAGPHLAVFDGGDALRSVIRPLVAPAGDHPRLESLTRRRHDARRHARPPMGRRPGQRGPTPEGGCKLPPPRQGGRWTRGWREGPASLSGRRPKVLWKEGVGLGRVSGHDVLVKAVVAQVEGSKKRFPRVTSAVGRTGWQRVEVFAARSRQEDGFRDLKQRLGLGGVPGVDPPPDRAHPPGAVGDDEPAATAAVPAGGRGVRGLVGATPLEPQEGPAERAGRGAVAQATPPGNPAAPVGVAGR